MGHVHPSRMANVEGASRRGRPLADFAAAAAPAAAAALSVAEMDEMNPVETAAAKEEPDFKPSGVLAAAAAAEAPPKASYGEPKDAAMPDRKWRLYVYRGDEAVGEPLHIHRKSFFIFGRDRGVVDIPTDHPSCSKEHFVLQFRRVPRKSDEGVISHVIRPYGIDLESTNGSFLNGDKIEPARYYELLEKDMLKFGLSSRDYLLLCQDSV